MARAESGRSALPMPVPGAAPCDDHITRGTPMRRALGYFAAMFGTVTALVVTK